MNQGGNVMQRLLSVAAVTILTVMAVCTSSGTDSDSDPDFRKGLMDSIGSRVQASCRMMCVTCV
jgi:hypothetical protein